MDGQTDGRMDGRTNERRDGWATDLWELDVKLQIIFTNIHRISEIFTLFSLTSERFKTLAHFI